MVLETINFNQSKNLLDKGFPKYGCCYEYFDADGHILDKDCDIFRICYPKPSLELVAKWMRDVKNINICVYRTACGWLYILESIPSGTDIYSNHNDYDGDDESTGQFSTYEKALSSAIDKCIEKYLK